MKLRLSVIFISLILAGCASNTSKPPSIQYPTLNPTQGPSENYLDNQIYPVDAFDEVVFLGNMNVTINGHAPKTELRVIQTTPTQTAITAYTKDGVLYVKYPYTGSSKTPIEVELDLANDVGRIVYDGDGQINAKNIGYSNLTLVLGSKSKTILSGNLVLQTLQLNGNATLYAYWLNTTNLSVVTQDNAKVFLGGIVTNLDVNASGNSYIDGRYLRVDNAFVKTSGNANVGVTVKHSMSNWSNDAGTVYYYKDSNFSTSYLSNSGSSLRMVGLPNN